MFDKNEAPSAPSAPSWADMEQDLLLCDASDVIFSSAASRAQGECLLFAVTSSASALRAQYPT